MLRKFTNSDLYYCRWRHDENGNVAPFGNKLNDILFEEIIFKKFIVSDFLLQKFTTVIISFTC